MADETGSTGLETAATEAPTNDAPAPATVDGAADALDQSTLIGDAGKPEGGDLKADEGAKPDEKPAVVAPETYDLKAPEGSSFDVEAFKVAEPVLRDLNLTNDQAQKLVDVYPKLMESAANAANQRTISEISAVRADWAKGTQADPELGGVNFEQTKAMAAKAMDRLEVGEDFRTFLNDTGLGNHPEMIRMLSRAGKAFSEDGFERGGQGGNKGRPIEERWYGTTGGE